MVNTSIHKFNLKQISLYGLTGILLGLIYISIVNGFSKMYPFVNGTFIGLLLGLMIGTFEIYMFQPRFRRNSFILMLSFRVIIYTVSIIIIILLVVTLNRSIRHHQLFFEALVSQESQNYIIDGNFKTAIIFTLIISVVVNFTRLISFKIGRGTLINFFLGAYHKPKLKERIFVFLQITNANQVLKNSRIEAYHNFINEIFSEISVAVMHNKGYVYEYVDDQIIVYWKGTQKDWGNFLINFYGEVLLVMKRDKAHFEKMYNLVPNLFLGAHGGTVVQAEIGELKTEIVFHGDVLNTTARIANVAREKDMAFVISNYIFERIKKSEYVTTTSIGQIELRGKQQATSLFSMTHDFI